MPQLSPLSFTDSISEFFRDGMITRNLPPYTSEGAFVSNEQNGGIYPIKLRDSKVNDSEELIKQFPRYLESVSVLNAFSPNDGFQSPINIKTLQGDVKTLGEYFNFVASTYTLSNIITQNSPVGSFGSINDDSELARNSAVYLKQQFEYRIQQEVAEGTLGRLNFLDGLRDPVQAADLLTGRRTLIERSWQISQPDNPVAKGLDLMSRVTGSYSPYSWIPGDYFTEPESDPNIIDTVRDGFKNFILGKPDLSPSKNFLQNTGGGQKSSLFRQLEFNRFKPDYRDSQVRAAEGLLAQGVQNLGELTKKLGGIQPPSGFAYVGTPESSIENMTAPPDLQPEGMNGVSVFGNGILGMEYEGDQNFKFGLVGKAYIDQGNLEGGFTWFNLNQDNIGIIPGPNNENAAFVSVPSSIGATLSSNYEFKENSILDRTQKIIDATPSGGKKLQSVGNAINQISKVFDDGYKQMTKGSRVVKYETVDGIEVGQEYCRIFTKDKPFKTIGDLQKTQSNIRKFTNSVLDNPYNLNIYPTKGNDATYSIGQGDSGQVKKYMLSLENLAWRSSSKKGYTVQDLPLCERGPNGGRIMWFPPYDLKFSENSSATWNKVNFIGRPESIYSYNNSTRTVTLSFKIIVDHPSVLNLVTDKVLKTKSPEVVNDVLQSFYAGCKDYDLYELAAIYNTVPLSELQQIQEIINRTANEDTLTEAIKKITKEPAISVPAEVPEEVDILVPDITEYDITTPNFSCYFNNDVPSSGSANYGTLLTEYLDAEDFIAGHANQEEAEKIRNGFNGVVKQSLFEIENLTKEIYDVCENGGEVTIELIGKTSTIGSASYNEALSQRRIDSIKNFIKDYTFGDGLSVAKFIGQSLFFIENPVGETLGISQDTGVNAVYSMNAIKDRSVDVVIKNVEVGTKFEEPEAPEPVVLEDELPNPTDLSSGADGKFGTNVQQPVSYTETVTTEVNNLPGAAKKVLRSLLSECNYFEMIKESTPVVYDSLKEKLKYFHPAFHSMTPEGLNSRLTFLNQCLRPGETIPTIGSDGQVTRNDANNTAFGAPPIVVLRIGDFFNTKCVINSVSLQYEGLDINPEGIGVQPMIADVSLTMDIIGGSGLREPINRLQNALSFNYYGNTEMYDERAIATEDTSEIDNNLIKKIQEETAVTNTIQNNNQAPSGTYIGDVLNTTNGDSGFTVEISYEKILNEIKTSTRDYVYSVYNTLNDVATKRGWGFVGKIFETRNYIAGDVGLDSMLFFGYPRIVQSKIEDIYLKATEFFENDGGTLLSAVNSTDTLKNSTKRKIRKNLISYIADDKSRVNNEVYSSINEMGNVSMELVSKFNKLSYVFNNSSDGFIDKKGKPVIVDMSLPTQNDVSPFKEIGQISTDVSFFKTDCIDSIDPYSEQTFFESMGATYYEYLVLYEFIIDPELSSLMIDSLVANITNDAEYDLAYEILTNITDTMRKGLSLAAFNNATIINSYENDASLTKEKYGQFKTKTDQKFDVYEPYQSQTNLKFEGTYNSSPNTNQVDGLKNLYKSVNTGDPLYFNDKVRFTDNPTGI